MLSPFANTLYDPDTTSCPVVAYHLDFVEYEAEVPVRIYHKGRLIIVLYGAVSCQARNNLWIMLPRCTVWIPGGIPHSVSATWNTRLNYPFIEPGTATLPDSYCTLALSPLIHELVERFTRERTDYVAGSHTGRPARVTLDELATMPAQRLNLPVSVHPKIQAMIGRLVSHPDDRSTLSMWAEHLVLSERSPARMILRETGLTFGHWRQQLHLIITLQELASDVSVQNVAARLGYESVNAFITMSKRTMGTTPAHYFAKRQTAAHQENLVGPRRLAWHPTRQQGALMLSAA